MSDTKRRCTWCRTPMALQAKANVWVCPKCDHAASMPRWAEQVWAK